MEVIEAMETCVAMRYLKPDPVPEADLKRLIYAATRASNPSNSQLWSFIVVTDAELKSRLGRAVAAAMAEVTGRLTDSAATDASLAKMIAGAMYLVENFERIPALIVCCARNAYPPDNPSESMMYAAAYPAAQNLIVAARSMGLGSTFTTFQMLAESEFRAALRIPDDVLPCVTICVGYPERKFTKVKRNPVEDVLHWNGW